MELRVAVLVALAGCSGVSPQADSTHDRVTLVVRGSDTMLPLLQRWAERSERALPGLRVQVTGGGSGTGLRALADGTADIAASSRPAEPRERRAIAARTGGEVNEHVVALDAVVVYVNPGNAVDALTVDEVGALYRGRVDRWSALRGPDAPVVLYGRESSSGTYAFVKEHALRDEDYAPEVQSLPGSASVIAAVARDTGAVGYAGLVEARGVRAVPLRRADGHTVAPSLTTVRDGTYPLARPLHLYTAHNASAPVRRWITWVLAPEAQREAASAGFVPAPEGTAR
jgi:phosphate transport system substrate-binding protein